MMSPWLTALADLRSQFVDISKFDINVFSIRTTQPRHQFNRRVVRALPPARSWRGAKPIIDDRLGHTGGTCDDNAYSWRLVFFGRGGAGYDEFRDLARSAGSCISDLPRLIDVRDYEDNWIHYIIDLAILSVPGSPLRLQRVPLPLEWHPCDEQRSYVRLIPSLGAASAWAIDAIKYAHVNDQKSKISIETEPPPALDPSPSAPSRSPRPDDHTSRNPVLTRVQENILLTLLDMSAFDLESRRTSPDVMREANQTDAQSGNDKNSIAGLGRLELCGSKVGAKGGIWLTPKGRAIAERLQKNCADRSFKQ